MNDVQENLKTAMEGWKTYFTPPNSMPDSAFHRECLVQIGDRSIDSNELDVEFTVEFDDDLQANEAEIVVYNLSENTMNQIAADQWVSIVAGYQNDRGCIFTGYVDSVKVKRSGVDKTLTVKAYDDTRLSEKTYEKTTFAAGTKASDILQTLLEQVPMDVAEFQMDDAMDFTCDEDVVVEGDVLETIADYAQDCGISVYINKGKIYARPLDAGQAIGFTINKDTGMIDAPERVEESESGQEAEEGKPQKRPEQAYNVRMILQHRMETAAIVNLESKYVSGQFRVRKGKHTFNESEAVTEVEVVSFG